MIEGSDLQSPPDETERRRFLRAPLIVQRVRVQDDRRTFFGYAKNISRGGLYISTTNPKETGDRFLLEIPLPKPIEREVRCNCEVAWRRVWTAKTKVEPGMGIRFLDLPDSDAQAIERWVEGSGERDEPW